MFLIAFFLILLYYIINDLKSQQKKPLKYKDKKEKACYKRVAG